jgi:Butirosin biosynthesis protein H, N-terminal/Domain of unknown function (DUF4872)
MSSRRCTVVLELFVWRRASGKRGFPGSFAARGKSVTKQKHLKQLIRARMAKTQESYSTARRHIVDDSPPENYVLRGGVHPETATIANVLANRAVVSPHSDEPLTEAMVLGIGGGLGAGYILWEFKEHNLTTLVFGFRNQWQYPARWMDKTCTRLGISASIHETGGPAKAASQLTDALARGLPAIAWIDQQTIGYRHLPDYLSGWGGHPVVVYALQNDASLIDDRNLEHLTVPTDVVSAARGRITSYKNRLVVIDESSGELDEAVLRKAVVDGIEECIAHLNQPSDSFSLPAWRKWARLVADTRNKKAWPKVFEKATGLFGALVSVYESVAGGTLRNLYASFLDEAAEIVEASELQAVATSWRDADRLWHAVAQRALPDEEPFTSVRRALDDYGTALNEGDAGSARAAQASETIWQLREELDANPPWGDGATDDLLAELSRAVQAVYAAEVDALARMEEAVAGVRK